MAIEAALILNKNALSPSSVAARAHGRAVAAPRMPADYLRAWSHDAEALQTYCYQRVDLSSLITSRRPVVAMQLALPRDMNDAAHREVQRQAAPLLTWHPELFHEIVMGLGTRNFESIDLGGWLKMAGALVKPAAFTEARLPLNRPDFSAFFHQAEKSPMAWDIEGSHFNLWRKMSRIVNTCRAEIAQLEGNIRVDHPEMKSPIACADTKLVAGQGFMPITLPSPGFIASNSPLTVLGNRGGDFLFVAAISPTQALLSMPSLNELARFASLDDNAQAKFINLFTLANATTAYDCRLHSVEFVEEHLGWASDLHPMNRNYMVSSRLDALLMTS